MKIVFFGTPDFVIPILETLINHYDVIAIVTTPDQKVGRKQILSPSPVKIAYKKYSITNGRIFTPEKLDKEFIKAITNLHPNLFIVAAYGKIIPKAVLDIPIHGALNIHPSLLPLYRGPSPLQTQLLHGEKKTGITIIKMDEKMDHGPIVAVKEEEIRENDTFESLAKRMFQQASNILPSVIDDYLSNKIILKEQNHDKATFTQIISKQDGYFDSQKPPAKEKLDHMIRAFYPWPTAWTRLHLEGGRMKRSGIHDSLKVKKQEKILKFFPEKEIQLEGSKKMPIKDFLNGYPELKQFVEQLVG